MCSEYFLPYGIKYSLIDPSPCQKACAQKACAKIFDFNKSAGFSPGQEALEIIGVS